MEKQYKLNYFLVYLVIAFGFAMSGNFNPFWSIEYWITCLPAWILLFSVIKK